MLLVLVPSLPPVRTGGQRSWRPIYRKRGRGRDLFAFLSRIPIHTSPHTSHPAFRPATAPADSTLTLEEISPRCKRRRAILPASSPAASRLPAAEPASLSRNISSLVSAEAAFPSGSDSSPASDGAAAVAFGRRCYRFCESNWKSTGRAGGSRHG